MYEDSGLQLVTNDVRAPPPRVARRHSLQLWARENAILPSLCSYGLGKRCEGLKNI